VETAVTQREVNRRFDSLSAALRMGQWPVVLDGLRGILDLDPANELAIRSLRRIYFDEVKKPQEFRPWVSAHIQKHRSNSAAMRDLAILLCEPDRLSRHVPDLALEAAKAAYEAKDPHEPGAAAAYARALYHVGHFDRAIALQEEVVKAVSESEQEDARSVLEVYKLCKQLHSTSP